jgi:hypothetical protein
MQDQPRHSRPIHENIRLQNTYWIVERIGWCFLALVVVLALLGVFSRGILSDAKARRNGLPLVVEYERFQRVTALTRFRITIDEARKVLAQQDPERQDDVRQDEVRLRLSPSFQNAYEIEAILPRSARSVSGPEGLGLLFEPPESGAAIIVISVRPRDFGPVPLEFGIAGGALQFSVFIYP